MYIENVSIIQKYFLISKITLDNNINYDDVYLD